VVRVNSLNVCTIFRASIDGCSEIAVLFLTPIDIQIPLPKWLLKYIGGAGLQQAMKHVQEAVTCYEDYRKIRKEEVN